MALEMPWCDLRVLLEGLEWEFAPEES